MVDVLDFAPGNRPAVALERRQARFHDEPAPAAFFDGADDRAYPLAPAQLDAVVLEPSGVRSARRDFKCLREAVFDHGPGLPSAPGPKRSRRQPLRFPEPLSPQEQLAGEQV